MKAAQRGVHDHTGTCQWRRHRQCSDQPGTGLGLLEFLDGTPITGAPILIQVRAVSRKGEVVTERTLAETTTDSAGRWARYATPIREAGQRRMWLRALCPGGPGFGAAVSEPLRVPAGISLAAPTANPPVQPTATPVS